MSTIDKDLLNKKVEYPMNNINVIISDIGRVTGAVADVTKIVSDPIIDHLKQLTDKIKKDNLEYAQYKKNNITMEDILSILEGNYNDHGVKYGIFECSKLRQKELKKLQDLGCIPGTPTMDELAEVRPELISTCCYIKDLKLSDFVKIELTGAKLI